MRLKTPTNLKQSCLVTLIIVEGDITVSTAYAEISRIVLTLDMIS